MRQCSNLAVAILLLLYFHSAASSQPAGNPYSFIPYPAAEDERGFVSLFDGRSLRGWSGDPTYWRVENGSIVGETTPFTLLKEHNNFLVWGGGAIADFELRLSYRISSEGNSGVNYRSEHSSPKGTMKGYQFDIDGPAAAKLSRRIMLEHGLKIPSFAVPGRFVDPPAEPRVTANIYEERGRGILALAGTLGRTSGQDGAHVDALLGDEQLVSSVERPDWNDLRIIARGNVLMHVLNNRVMAVLVDGDRAQARRSGLIGMQVHVGPPSKVEFRNIRLRIVK